MAPSAALETDDPAEATEPLSAARGLAHWKADWSPRLCRPTGAKVPLGGNK